MKEILKETMDSNRDITKGMAKQKKVVLDADEKLTKLVKNR